MKYSVFLFVLAALTAGCVGDRNEPEITVIAVAGGGTEVRYPLDQYQAMGDQRVAIDMAQAVLVQRCLARQGMDLPLGPPDKIVDEPKRPDWYGVTTEHGARDAGYNAVARPVEDLPFVQRIGKQAQALLGGCVDEANRIISAGSSPVADAYLVVTLEKQALKTSQQDSRVQDAIGEWRACMRDAGHEFGDPWEPYDYWRDRRSPAAAKHDPRGALTQAEVAMALTDVRCKNRTKLLDTWVAATIAYQRELIAGHAGELRRHQQVLDVNVANANRVTRELGTGGQ